jgi:hypothetical protein
LAYMNQGHPDAKSGWPFVSLNPQPAASQQSAMPSPLAAGGKSLCDYRSAGMEPQSLIRCFEVRGDRTAAAKLPPSKGDCSNEQA